MTSAVTLSTGVAEPHQGNMEHALLELQIIATYLDAFEQLAKALSTTDAKAACLKLRELID